MWRVVRAAGPSAKPPTSLKCGPDLWSALLSAQVHLYRLTPFSDMFPVPFCLREEGMVVIGPNGAENPKGGHFQSAPTAMDSRTCYLVVSKMKVYMWKGSRPERTGIACGTSANRRSDDCLRSPPPPPGVGWVVWVRGQKEVCVPKIGLKFPAPLIDFVFCLRTIFGYAFGYATPITPKTGGHMVPAPAPDLPPGTGRSRTQSPPPPPRVFPTPFLTVVRCGPVGRCLGGAVFLPVTVAQFVSVPTRLASPYIQEHDACVTCIPASRG